MSGAKIIGGNGIYPRVTEYMVSVFPDSMWDSADLMTASESHTWSLIVAYRGRGQWAVTRGGRDCLGSDGMWDWEPIPSEREDDWLATHRFPLDAALELAAEYAPKIIINGKTAREILAKHEARAAAKGGPR